MPLTKKVFVLNRFSIPSAVTGGLLCGIVIAPLLNSLWGINLEFDLQLRDILLLVIPLIGAFFIDVVNAFVLQFFMQLPIFTP